MDTQEPFRQQNTKVNNVIKFTKTHNFAVIVRYAKVKAAKLR